MKRFKKKFATRKSFDRLDDQSQSEQEKKRPADLKRGGSSTTKTTTSSNSGRSIGKSRTKASASPKGKDRTKGASVSSPYKNDTNSSYSSTSSSLINSNRTKSAKSPSGPSTKRTLLKSLRPAPISSLPYLSQGLTPFEYDSFTPNSDHSHSVSHNHSINLDSNSNSSNNNSIFTSQNYMSQRARTNWDVQDSKLNPIPPFHPPISPIYATYVGDTSSTPSIIASRISECLRKRSMVVEFDSDSANPTATCLNQDGVLFVICLYRGSKGVPMYTNTNTRDQNLSGSSSGSQHERGSSSKSPRTRSSMSSYSPLHHSFDRGYGDSRNLNSSSNINTQQTQTQNHPDFSNGVIVECTKIRGDLISFHRDCRQILSCTSGDSDGLDDLRSSNCAMLQSPHGFGYKRWQAKKPFGILKTEEILQCEPDVFPSLINVRAMNRNMNVNMNSPTRINVATNNNADPSSPRSTTSSNSRYSSSSSYTASSKSPRIKTNTKTRNKKHFTHATYEALGKVLANLENERVDARLLAMESLIMLTDTKSSGIERAYLASLCVLGSSSSSIRRKWDSVGVGVGAFGAFEGKLSPLHERVVLLAMGKFKQTTLQPHLMAGHDSDGYLNEYGDGADVNGEHGEHGNIFTNDSNTNANTHNRNRTTEIDMNLHIHNDDDLDTDTCDCDIIKEYNIQIRRYAMHVLTNALSNLLHHHESFPLLPKPNCEEFMTQEFLERLGDDLRGATRPPMASLGSAHEATYAARFIHLIAGYSEDGFRFVNGAVVGMTTGVTNTNVGTSVNNNPSSPSSLSTSRSLFGLLDRARVAGSACHRALELECQLAQAAIAIGDKM